MQLEQYTEDAACFAMGLVRFELGEGEEGVRVLLRPSFTPEVCVTVFPGEIVMVGLKRMLWREVVVARMPEVAERAAITHEQYSSVCELFEGALEESRRPKKEVIILDGARVSAVRRAGKYVELFAGRGLGEAEKKLLGEVNRLALSKVRGAELRNLLMGRGCLAEVDANGPAVSRLMVLGTPEEREAFHRMFGARVKGNESDCS